MSSRFSVVTVTIAAAAIAAAGCGSGSKSKPNTAANPPAATSPAPATPSTGTGSVPSNLIPGKLSSSTPISSPVLRAALIKKLASVSAIPAKDDAPIADCVVKKLDSLGIKTYGEANKRLSDVRNAAGVCTRQVLTGG